MFLRLSSIHLTLASSHFLNWFPYAVFRISLFLFFCFSPFSIRFKISSSTHFCFVFLSTLRICSTAASVITTLNFAQCWSSSSAKTSNLFGTATRYFFRSVWLDFNNAKSSLLFLALLRIFSNISMNVAACPRIDICWERSALCWLAWQKT